MGASDLIGYPPTGTPPDGCMRQGAFGQGVICIFSIGQRPPWAEPPISQNETAKARQTEGNWHSAYCLFAFAGAVLHRQQVLHPGPAQWGLDAHCPNRCRDLAAISWGLDLGRGRANRPPLDCPDGDDGPMVSSWPALRQSLGGASDGPNSLCRWPKGSQKRSRLRIYHLRLRCWRCWPLAMPMMPRCSRLLAIHCDRQPGHGIGQLLALVLKFLKRDGCCLVCCVAAALEVSKPRGKCGAGHCLLSRGFTAAA